MGGYSGGRGTRPPQLEWGRQASKQASLFAQLINKYIISMNNIQGQAARKAHKAQHCWPPCKKKFSPEFVIFVSTLNRLFCVCGSCCRENLQPSPNPLARLSRPLGGEGKAMRKGEERRGRKKGKGMGRKRKSGLSPSKKNS